MPQGLQVFDASGNVIFDSNDKVLKEVGDFVVSSSASFDANAYLTAANALLAMENVSTDQQNQANSAPAYLYSGGQVAVTNSDTSRPMNARVKVMVF